MSLDVCRGCDSADVAGLTAIARLSVEFLTQDIQRERLCRWRLLFRLFALCASGSLRALALWIRVVEQYEEGRGIRGFCERPILFNVRSVLGSASVPLAVVSS